MNGNVEFEGAGNGTWSAVRAKAAAEVVAATFRLHRARCTATGVTAT